MKIHFHKKENGKKKPGVRLLLVYLLGFYELNNNIKYTVRKDLTAWTASNEVSGVGSVVQWARCLPRTREALSSIPRTT